MPQIDGQADDSNKWLVIGISSLVTLLVTVVSGVAVYYITREPPAPPAAENLIYSIEKSAAFDSGRGSVTFMTITVENRGTLAAHNVRVMMPSGSNWQVANKKISISSGAAAPYEDLSSKGDIEIRFKSFVPSEKVKISALLNGLAPTQPDISVQSDDTVGKHTSTQADGFVTKNSDHKIIEIVLLIAAGLIVQAALIFGVRRLSSVWEASFGGYHSRNNTAFVFLLQGLTKDAEELLSVAIGKEGAGVFELANQGLALGLQGNTDIAAKRFEAAEWIAQSSHGRAVIAFNRATLAMHEGKFDDAAARAEEGILLEPFRNWEVLSIQHLCARGGQAKHGFGEDRSVKRTRVKFWRSPPD